MYALLIISEKMGNAVLVHVVSSKRCIHLKDRLFFHIYNRCMCKTSGSVVPQGANSIVGTAFLVNFHSLFKNENEGMVVGSVMVSLL